MQSSTAEDISGSVADMPTYCHDPSVPASSCATDDNNANNDLHVGNEIFENVIPNAEELTSSFHDVGHFMPVENNHNYPHVGNGNSQQDTATGEIQSTSYHDAASFMPIDNTDNYNTPVLFEDYEKHIATADARFTSYDDVAGSMPFDNTDNDNTHLAVGESQTDIPTADAMFTSYHDVAYLMPFDNTNNDNTHLAVGESQKDIPTAEGTGSFSTEHYHDMQTVMQFGKTDKEQTHVAQEGSEEYFQNVKDDCIPSAVHDYVATVLSLDNSHKQSVNVSSSVDKPHWHISNVMVMYKSRNEFEEFTLPDEILRLQSRYETEAACSIEHFCGQKAVDQFGFTANDDDNDEFSDFTVPEDILTSDSEYIASQFQDLLDD